MIDLTPLDVRKKRGDFRKPLRGYDPDEVDAFLELVAERLEVLVKENLTLKERSERLTEQIQDLGGRERAVHEALVTAQELREKIETQAREQAEMVVREAESKAQLIIREAEGDADLLRREAAQELERAKQDVQRIRSEIDGDIDRAVREAEKRIEEYSESIEALERQRTRFLKGYRAMLERELDVVEVEESKRAHEESAIELDLAGGKARAKAALAALEDTSSAAAAKAAAASRTPAQPAAEAESDLGEAVAASDPFAEGREHAASEDAAAESPAASEASGGDGDEAADEGAPSLAVDAATDDADAAGADAIWAGADDGSDPLDKPVGESIEADADPGAPASADAARPDAGRVEDSAESGSAAPSQENEFAIADLTLVEAAETNAEGASEGADSAPATTNGGGLTEEPAASPVTADVQEAGDEDAAVDAADEEAKTARALESLWLTPLIKDEPSEAEDDSRV